MEQEERKYGLLPVVLSTHRYQVGKVKFHVASHFRGKATIEQRLADLMIEDLESGKKENTDAEEFAVAI